MSCSGHSFPPYTDGLTYEQWRAKWAPFSERELDLRARAHVAFEAWQTIALEQLQEERVVMDAARARGIEPPSRFKDGT